MTEYGEYGFYGSLADALGEYASRLIVVVLVAVLGFNQLWLLDKHVNGLDTGTINMQYQLIGFLIFLYPAIPFIRLGIAEYSDTKGKLTLGAILLYGVLYSLVAVFGVGGLL